MSTELYDQDFYQWALRNAELMRQGKFSEIDVENIAEELEDMGKNKKTELESCLVQLLMHLLKWQFQPGRKGTSWRKTIVEQRRQLVLLLKDSPSLKHIMNETLKEAYDMADDDFQAETGISKKKVPTECPYTFEQVMDREFWP